MEAIALQPPPHSLDKLAQTFVKKIKRELELVREWFASNDENDKPHPNDKQEKSIKKTKGAANPKRQARIDRLNAKQPINDDRSASGGGNFGGRKKN